jgi:hypothetical protein
MMISSASAAIERAPAAAKTMGIESIRRARTASAVMFTMKLRL